MALFERRRRTRPCRALPRLPFNTFAVLFRDCYLTKFGNAERGGDDDDDDDDDDGMCDVHRPPG